MSEETPPQEVAPIGPAIPSHINELGRYEAARYYVEALGWAIQPLYGPTQGRGRERGKKAVRKGWKHHTLEDATPEFLARYFGGKKDYNLGCSISGDFVHVDLDSKADKGASVMEWLAGVPGLAEVPRERTGGGVHLVFRCRDLPASVQMAQAPLVHQINEAVTAELFFAGLTIVLSPSVHASGHQYHWEVTGEIPLVSWADLHAWFGFREDGGGGVEGKKRKKDRSWLADWKEDLRSLDLVSALEEESLPLEEMVERFEQGTQLLRRCEDVLGSARKRLKTIAARDSASPSADDGDEKPLTPKASDITDAPDDDDEIRLF